MCVHIQMVVLLDGPQFKFGSGSVFGAQPEFQKWASSVAQWSVGFSRAFSSPCENSILFEL